MRRNSFLTLALFPLFFSSFILSGCGKSESTKISGDESYFGGTCDNSGDDTSSMMSGIVNGRKLGQNNAVANRIVSLIFTSGIDSTTGKESKGICTGSLLTGNIVLTAAHCMPSTKVAKDILVIFTNNLSCLTPNNLAQLARPASALRINSSYSGTNEGDSDNDIAMLKFSGDLPAGYQTFDVPSLSITIEPTDKLIMAGYGVTRYKNEDSNMLRITSVPGDRVSAKTTKLKTYIVDQRETGVCSGDSGGPMMVYKYGRLQIVGIASAVTNPSSIFESDLCSGNSQFVDVSKQLDWISTNYNWLR